jgi:hypothetical protein
VAFVSTADADQVLLGTTPSDWALTQRLFMLKMRQAQIVYDRSGRLGRAQQLAQTLEAAGQLVPLSAYSSVYAAWFWENFSLLHLKRMAQADDPVYHTAIDMMLVGALSRIGSEYFVLRSLAWEGEKAAVRYWQEHDPSFLALLRECLACPDRRQKIALYERLVRRAIEERGEPWSPGAGALILAGPTEGQAAVEQGLHFWEALVSEGPASA